MRFSKKYFVFALLMVLTLIWKFNSWDDKYAAVETFRGAELKDEVFYPLMAKSINDSRVARLFINGQEYAINNDEMLLDNNLLPVVSLDFVRDTLKGAIYRQDDPSVVLQVTDDIYEFLIGNGTATKNGDDINLYSSPMEYSGRTYVGLQDMCELMGYDFIYEDGGYDIYVGIDEYPDLPRQFDLREAGRVSEIRDQGLDASCWACASLEALESSLLPYNPHTFSVDSMIKDNSFNRAEEDGGEYTMALAYLLSWQGPQEQSDNSLLQTLGTADTTTKPVHLQGAQFYDSEDLDKIKWAVYRYGGVSTSIYANVGIANLNASLNYNQQTNSYAYVGDNKPNHDVVIIGWDDNYAAANFRESVPGNGAFICQNSWGSDFGDQGVFYISYYDTNIGNQSVSYTSVDTLGRYDNIYQSDLCGWVGNIGYNKEWAYGANVFTATGSQTVTAAGFYALDVDTTYQLYFVSDYQNTGSLANRVLVAEGYLEEAGYYTISFDKAMEVAPEETFAIVLCINTPDMKQPLAVEYADEDMGSVVDLEDGQGFISNNGLDWENVLDVAQANLCIKAYSKNKLDVLE